MSLVMYERVGHEDRRPSPFSWRIRYALAHKGVPVEFRHVRFADVETIRALSGQHFVPVVTDGDQVIHDSWNIACYLEDRFPAGTIDVEALHAAGLVPRTSHTVKILAEGELTKKFVVKASAFSGSAKEKIEKAGGTAEVVAD